MLAIMILTIISYAIAAGGGGGSGGDFNRSLNHFYSLRKATEDQKQYILTSNRKIPQIHRLVSVKVSCAIDTYHAIGLPTPGQQPHRLSRATSLGPHQYQQPRRDHAVWQGIRLQRSTRRAESAYTPPRSFRS